VNEPKLDGYRSVHLMYRYSGRAERAPWDNLRIEIQLRTKLQHEWATAVEAVDLCRGDRLKFGQGNPDRTRFFALMGCADASRENASLVPGTPESEGLLNEEICHLENRLCVIDTLGTYALVPHYFGATAAPNRYWFIIRTRPSERRVEISGYAKRQLALAENRYSELEMETRGTDQQVVLVSSESMAALRRSYPNYFADTRQFVGRIRDITERNA
jgi:hypothetical protein